MSNRINCNRSPITLNENVKCDAFFYAMCSASMARIRQQGYFAILFESAENKSYDSFPKGNNEENIIEATRLKMIEKRLSLPLSFPLAIIFFVGLSLFGISAIIIVSLIPIYLPSSAGDIIVTNVLTSFKATYTTNVVNASKVLRTDSTLLSFSLNDQLHLRKSTKINLILSKFISSSTNSKKKRQNICDRDTKAFSGDFYTIETEIADANVCHTEHCQKKFSEEINHAVQLYSTLNLPFYSIDGSRINVSMILCKFDELFSAPATCFDGIQNQDESDIDCGGSRCSRQCKINRKCFKTSDCDNSTCVLGICLDESTKILTVCQLIQMSVSSASLLFYSTDSGYDETIEHYSTSSNEISVCSIEPGTANDVGLVLKLIGDFRVPFGIKGGGHSANPGFSSTTGVLIVMKRLRHVNYDPNNEVVEIGAGLTWNDVYQSLDPFNVSVLGGRIASVGVGGLILGGGYGWKTNQYGLSIDNVIEFELISPNGTIVYVNEMSYPDIFFGLKGGFNNFGIVTKFTMRALAQTQVYGGILYYSPLQLNEIIQAVAHFAANNQDPRAQIIGSFIIAPGQYVLAFLFFYDAPTVPKETFQEFLSISAFGTLKTQSYVSLVNAAPADQTANLRGRRSTVSVTRLTLNLLVRINNLLLYYNSTLGSKVGAILIFSVQPFISTYLDRSQGGAYPHEASTTPLIPIEIEFSWALPSDDQAFIDAIESATNAILQAALDDGQDVGGPKQILYPNYALDGTPLQQMYGDNLPRLRSIRQTWDPENVMYLTGGFKF